MARVLWKILHIVNYYAEGGVFVVHTQLIKVSIANNEAVN